MKYIAVVLLGGAMTVGAAQAESDDAGDLAKASQNPIGSLVSLPFQNNTSFGIGPDDAVSNVLNIQPVYPVSLLPNWNLVNRGIVPVIYREEVFPGTGSASGLGDISYTGFISPAKPGKLIWGGDPHSCFRRPRKNSSPAKNGRPGPGS
jgi:hypothetical protein